MKRIPKPKTVFYKFTKIWSSYGTTVYPGTTIKGPFKETTDTVSVPGSFTFKDIPKDSLELYIPSRFKRERKPKEISNKTKGKKQKNENKLNENKPK